MVDSPALGFGVERHVGSSPTDHILFIFIKYIVTFGLYYYSHFLMV